MTRLGTSGLGLVVVAWFTVAAATVSAAPPNDHARAGMDDAGGAAVGVALDLVGLDGTSQDVFAEDSPSIGVTGWIRYDVWRPDDFWALGLLVSASHHSEGEEPEPPNPFNALQNAANGTAEEPPTDVVAERATDSLLAGVELRHGLTPWLIPFARVAGGITFISADFTDPSDCARLEPFEIPGIELPGDAAPDLCTAYRVHHDSTTAPVMQTTLGLSLRPSPDVRATRVVASPIALSIEGGYSLQGDTSLAADGIDDAELAQHIRRLNASSWLARVSLHVWF